MTYDFKNELKKQELENPKDILNICGEGQVTLRKTTDRSSITQQEYTAMGIILDDLKKIFKTIPEEDINNRDFCRGYSIGETVWNNALHVFFKEKYGVSRENIDIIFSVKDHLPTLEISVEKDGKIVYEN
jgi:hypothetical protein